MQTFAAFEVLENRLFMAAGEVDLSFGTKGVVNRAVAKLTANGAPDNAFSGGGRATYKVVAGTASRQSGIGGITFDAQQRVVFADDVYRGAVSDFLQTARHHAH